MLHSTKWRVSFVCSTSHTQPALSYFYLCRISFFPFRLPLQILRFRVECQTQLSFKNICSKSIKQHLNAMIFLLLYLPLCWHYKATSWLADYKGHRVLLNNFHDMHSNRKFWNILADKIDAKFTQKKAITYIHILRCVSRSFNNGSVDPLHKC